MKERTIINSYENSIGRTLILIVFESVDIGLLLDTRSYLHCIMKFRKYQNTFFWKRIRSTSRPFSALEPSRIATGKV